MRRPTRPISPAQHWVQIRSPANQSQISRRYPSTIPSNSAWVTPAWRSALHRDHSHSTNAVVGPQHGGQVLALEHLGQPDLGPDRGLVGQVQCG